MTPRFIADVHLGKLAKHLRMLGLDVFYRNDLSKETLMAVASNENRILLSRNPAFSGEKEFRSYHIATENPLEQLKTVVQAFALQTQLYPFTRCLVCNGQLLPMQKEDITSLLKENTKLFYSEFWQCASCQRLYWKGSHYDRMLQLINTVLQR